MNEFISKTKKLIKEKGIKQRYLAQKMGISERKLSDILNGRKKIDIEIILLFCNALKIEPNELIYYESKEQKGA